MFLAHIVQDMIKGASQYKGKVVTRYAVSPEWDGRDRHERTSDGSIFTRFEQLKHQLVCFRNFKLKGSVTLVLTKVRKVPFERFVSSAHTFLQFCHTSHVLTNFYNVSSNITILI